MPLEENRSATLLVGLAMTGCAVLFIGWIISLVIVVMAMFDGGRLLGKHSERYALPAIAYAFIVGGAGFILSR